MKRLLLVMTFACAAVWAAEAVAQLPAGDLRVWLKADAGVISDDQGLATIWEDQYEKY